MPGERNTQWENKESTSVLFQELQKMLISQVTLSCVVKQLKNKSGYKTTSIRWYTSQESEKLA